jgi:HTH-type transcriptional regulator/antitoxin MqsA
MQKCASCGFNHIEHKAMDIPYKYMGKATVIPAVECDHCPECGEVFLGPEEARRADEFMRVFNSEVCASFGVTPEFIRQVRKKLNLGQKEAGKIFGGGVNAFSRYEKGKTPPPIPLVKLLRILDAHPELLSLAQ